MAPKRPAQADEDPPVSPHGTRGATKRQSLEAIPSEVAKAASGDGNVPQEVRRGAFQSVLCPLCQKAPLLKTCVHEGCLRCCLKACESGGAPCPAHAAKQQKRAEEAKLVAAVLERSLKTGAKKIGRPRMSFGGDKLGKGPNMNEFSTSHLSEGGASSSSKFRKRSGGVGGEEAFEETGDTVVIWCLRTYLATKAFSQDHLEADRRALRKVGTGSTSPRLGGSSSTAAVAAVANGESSSSSSSSSAVAPPGAGMSNSSKKASRAVARRARRAASALLVDFVKAAAAISSQQRT